jgi:hypothetical protein
MTNCQELVAERAMLAVNTTPTTDETWFHAVTLANPDTATGLSDPQEMWVCPEKGLISWCDPGDAPETGVVYGGDLAEKYAGALLVFLPT